MKERKPAKAISFLKKYLFIYFFYQWGIFNLNQAILYFGENVLRHNGKENMLSYMYYTQNAFWQCILDQKKCVQARVFMNLGKKCDSRVLYSLRGNSDSSARIGRGGGLLERAGLTLQNRLNFDDFTI